MPARQRGGHAGGGGAEPAVRRVRRYTANYKLEVIQRYDALDRDAKREFLRSERLRPSQVSEWRARVYAAGLEALSSDAGGQPARRIHVSDPVWADLAALAASASPPMSPERLARALFNYVTGREASLPVTPRQPAGGRAGTREAG